jgi:hypothetical protein
MGLYQSEEWCQKRDVRTVIPHRRPYEEAARDGEGDPLEDDAWPERLSGPAAGHVALIRVTLRSACSVNNSQGA